MRYALPLCLALAAPAAADVTATFTEGAPKDAFSFVASNGCLSGPVTIELDLTGSPAGLIFDVSDQGDGVEVFQPFELVSGHTLVVQASPVADGDTSLTLGLRALPEGQSVRFTIDLDDTIGAREITVSRSEIVGATVAVEANGVRQVAAFGPDAKAVVPTADCQS